ncbi:hypothetical protein V6N13_004525 [Hibiscus sabdariffa]|uniref:EF-hand domain-containing protein n=1 Tax=Hibiscus sabdariffa TaxID=183260 RepID=A0ABR2RYR0_9ROSI
MNHYECNNVHKDCRRTRGRGSTRKPNRASVHNPIEQSMPVSGHFDLGRIAHHFRSVSSNINEESLFRRCDYNGEGFLSKEELKAALKTLESRFAAIRASRALGHAEGLISEEELDVLVEYAINHGFTLNIK